MYYPSCLSELVSSSKRLSRRSVHALADLRFGDSWEHLEAIRARIRAKKATSCAPLDGLVRLHASMRRKVGVARLARERPGKEPWLTQPVAALVITHGTAAGQQISAPAARKMLLLVPVLLLLLLLLLLIILLLRLRLVVLFKSMLLADRILLRLRLWAPVLALGDMALGRLEMGKGLATGAAQVRPLARVRPDVSLQVGCS